MTKQEAITILKPFFLKGGFNKLFILPNGSWYENESYAFTDSKRLGVEYIEVTREEIEKTDKKK